MCPQSQAVSQFLLFFYPAGSSGGFFWQAAVNLYLPGSSVWGLVVGPVTLDLLMIKEKLLIFSLAFILLNDQK